jgi:Uncharacterized flagellar protein FlaG
MDANARLNPVPAASPVPAVPTDRPRSDNERQRQAEDAAARYRLVIEEGPQKGSFVYKTMDRVTGEVVRQLPREEVVRLMDDVNYGNGTVIDTRA